MSFIKKIFFVTLILFCLFFLNCCIKEYEEHEKFFDIRKMKVYSIIKGDRLLDYGYSLTTEYNQFNIVLDFRDSIYFYSENQNWSVNFINNAYAKHVCYGLCIQGNDGYLGSKEIIASIYITSNADFDSLHLAGDTLNDYFKVNQLLDSINYKANRYILISLNINPKLDSLHTFNIQYNQTNGEYYSGKTTLIFK